MPAGERRVVDALEVLDRGVDGAVDLFDEAGDWRDAFPALAGRSVRGLGALRVTGPGRR